MSVFSRTLAGVLIAGLSGPATAHQSFIVLDGGHPSRASAEELVCPGPDKELRCPGYQRRISYITCDGYFCYETAQPVGGGPAPQHALNVASVATNQIASSVQPADAQYRIFFAQTLGLPGVERWVPLVDWLLQDQQGLSRAQRLGVRAINMSMGDATVSCGTPVYSAALANLASKGVRLFNATGNTSANGFSRGSQPFPNGFYFLSGQNMCNNHVVSVGMTSFLQECIDSSGILQTDQDGGRCTHYPVFYKAAHAANTSFIANGCLSETQCGLHEQEIGTSFASPRVAGAVVAALLRNPLATTDTAVNRLDTVAEVGTYLVSTAPTSNPHHGQSIPFKRLGDSQFANVAQTICSNTVVTPKEGFWFNPNRSGTGVNVHIHGSHMSGTWFTYDGNGHPVWYQFSGLRSTCGNHFSGPVSLSTLTGGVHTQSAVGYATIAFFGSTSSRFDWELHVGSQRYRGSEQFSHLSWAGGAAGSPELTGLWAAPGESGWGYSISSFGNVHAPVLFIYTPSGQPRWLTAEGQSAVGGNVVFPLYYITHTNLCPWCLGPSEGQPHAVGSMTHHVSGNQVSVSVSSPSSSPPGQLSWSRQFTPVVRL